MPPEPHDRLKEARVQAGYESAAAACRGFGWNSVTYGKHENGERGISLKNAIKYGEALRVSAIWLLTGTDPAELKLTTEERSVLAKYRLLHTQARKAVHDLCDAFLAPRPGETTETVRLIPPRRRR